MANDRDDLGHVTMMSIDAALVAHLGGDRLRLRRPSGRHGNFPPGDDRLLRR
jgi:hypothetical protein